MAARKSDKKLMELFLELDKGVMEYVGNNYIEIYALVAKNVSEGNTDLALKGICLLLDYQHRLINKLMKEKNA